MRGPENTFPMPFRYIKFKIIIVKVNFFGRRWILIEMCPDNFSIDIFARQNKGWLTLDMKSYFGHDMFRKVWMTSEILKLKTMNHLLVALAVPETVQLPESYIFRQVRHQLELRFQLPPHSRSRLTRNDLLFGKVQTN